MTKHQPWTVWFPQRCICWAERGSYSQHRCITERATPQTLNSNWNKKVFQLVFLLRDAGEPHTRARLLLSNRALFSVYRRAIVFWNSFIQLSMKWKHKWAHLKNVLVLHLWKSKESMRSLISLQLSCLQCLSVLFFLTILWLRNLTKRHIWQM